MSVTMRLRCACGRNLADVTRDRVNPYWNTGAICVDPRPNVKMSVYRGDDQSDGYRYLNPTYTWSCRCGRTLTRRHERILAAYETHTMCEDPVVVVWVADIG